MNMKKFLLIAVVTCFTSTAFAQLNKQWMKAADDYFKNGDYFSAVEYYEKALGKNKGKSKVTGGFSPYSSTTVKPIKAIGTVSSKEQATVNLAESYRRLHYYEKAEPIYKEAMAFDKAQFPDVQYHYATTLRAMHKYDEAESNFKAFTAGSNNTALKEAAQKEIDDIAFAANQKSMVNAKLYTVQKAQKSLADTGAVYAPVWKDNTLYFTSSKPMKEVSRLQVNNTRIYMANRTDTGFGGIVNAGVPESKDIHQGAVSFSPDGNRMILTRWTIGNGKKLASLYMSKQVDGKWTEPIALPAVINQEGYSAQQPFWMPDGKTIMYSSNVPGGQGGFDLWTVTLDELDNAGTPVNMGLAINSAEDDQAPYYHIPSQTLVFSSNGRVGMGGMDFYYSKGTLGNWGPVTNFGFPVNSTKDDIYFASKGGASNILEDVLFASDRDASCCLELFTLARKLEPKNISGIVVDCNSKAPLKGATVSIRNAGNVELFSLNTGDDGSYAFTIDEYQQLKAIASAPDYQSGDLSFNKPADPTATSMRNADLCLEPIVVAKPIVVNNIYYDFDKADLREDSYPELDKLVTMFKANPNIKVEISAHTDSKGSDEYNKRLSDARAKSVVTYLVNKGIPATQLISVGYGASQPIAPNVNDDGSDNPEGRQMNRRTEFKVME